MFQSLTGNSDVARPFSDYRPGINVVVFQSLTGNSDVASIGERKWSDDEKLSFNPLQGILMWPEACHW